MNQTQPLRDGYLYCCSSSILLKAGFYKIGLTINLDQRLSHYQTPLMDPKFIMTLPKCPFPSEYDRKTNFPTKKLDLITLREDAVFKMLSKYRVDPKREIFNCTKEEIQDAFDKVETMDKGQLISYLEGILSPVKPKHEDDIEELRLELNRLKKENKRLQQDQTKRGISLKIDEALKGYKQVLFNKLDDILSQKAINNKDKEEIKSFLENGSRKQKKPISDLQPETKTKKSSKQTKKEKEPSLKVDNKLNVKKEKEISSKVDEKVMTKKTNKKETIQLFFLLYTEDKKTILPNSNTLCDFIHPVLEKLETDGTSISYNIQAVGNNQRVLDIKLKLNSDLDSKIKETKKVLSNILKEKQIKLELQKV